MAKANVVSLVFLVILALLVGGCGAPDKPSISLYLAVQRGDLDQLERHIFWKSDINARLPNGQHPIQVAAEKGRIIMVKTLLQHGVDIDSRSDEDQSAVDLAILNGRTEIAELLLERGATMDASQLLYHGARLGVTDRDIVRFLIARGADTEYRGEDGDTALLLAIRQDNHRLATHLVNEGADVNVKTEDGMSAVALARSLQFNELVRLLERQGAV
jgi:ankyrin repeat protein